MTKRVLGIILLFSVAAVAQQERKRPRITGVSHASFFTSNAAAAKRFYGELLGLEPGSWSGVYAVGTQSIEAEAKQPPANNSGMLSHIAFSTDDAEGMRRFLEANHVTVPGEVHAEKSGVRWFELKDPEGHPIEFVQERSERRASPRAISHRLIHAGFVVRDRAAEDSFYAGLLGFRVYWHGGMKDDQTDWLDMQVPEGTEWLEYMIVGKDSKADAGTLGILNHVALGVRDIKAAQKMLESRGWKPSARERAQVGRDGKWQLNLYDPDGTRVELMEFTPVEKPCCSPYVLPHPHD